MKILTKQSSKKCIAFFYYLPRLSSRWDYATPRNDDLMKYHNAHYQDF
ncbi:hypothetical protein RPATATE_1094 [Rickettsia parkeri str. Tate's Hell]|uniref:Uncharacterized protein n=1 Tax=Rickettsia parkeri str. Tate's Hell TaxID=1359189 RepID=A0ABR5DQU0_RICPA|nr:hypothetical protein RPAAT24_1430 [Rickettsia parkeri str. AT\